VIDVFSFILPIYYARRIHAITVAPARSCGFALGPVRKYFSPWNPTDRW
jgi:hypothetical protein